MFETLRCGWKGHLFVDNRTQPGVRVCVRCRRRRPFEGLELPSNGRELDSRPEAGAQV